jgi:dTDP-4-dehydrorhamnose reductase
VRQRILITGGSGLLALNWAQAVSDQCSVTLGLHNRQILLSHAQTQQIDLESIEKIVRSIEESSSQIVIHTAGLTNVDRCESEPELANHINVTLAANVAKACAIAGVGFVHISTDHLFSGQDSLVDESQPVAPINVYGQTKAEAEHQVLEINPRALVIRTNFFGWGTSYRHSFSDIVINALRSGSDLNLFQDVFYTPILIEALALAVHDLTEIKASGIFNVVGDERISKYEFGIKIAELFGLKKEKIKKDFISAHHELVNRPRDMSLSNLKVCNVLGRRLGNTRDHLIKLHAQEINGLKNQMRML